MLRHRVAAVAIAICGVVVLSSCGKDTGSIDTGLKISTIEIEGGSRAVEIGSTTKLTAIARDSLRNPVSVPFAWRSSADTIARFDPDGRLVALDTGRTIVTASALGVTSAPIQILVVFQGAAKIVAVGFNPPLAITPGAEPADSIRVVVTTPTGGAAIGARVRFAVTEGGGTVAPALDTVEANGLASAKWTLGPTAGKNTVTATVIEADGQTNTRVIGNPITFSVKSYAALVVVQGDGQTGNVLSALPVAPAVKLVDTAGKPRAGVPVTFAPTNNGRVANTIVSTSVDGVASPGVWTLGDTEGDQQLIVTVERAKIVLHATATGTTVRFAASQVATSSGATCTTAIDQLVSCMGQPPQTGTGDTVKTSTPTLTKGGVRFTTLAGSSTHFCGTTPQLAIYCWGVNALADTTNGFSPTGGPVATFEPTRLQSNIAWVQVAPGGQHNCAIANDGTTYCWGSDTSGQLGDDAITRHLVPKPIAGGFKFTTISAGSSHNCGITADATAFCWGLNSNGQIGDGTTTNRRTPTAVSGTFRWKAIGAGSSWSCGLLATGPAACWGAGTGRSVPTEYAGSPNFTSLTVGSAHACALTSDGTAYCWGDNSSGQLGDSTTTSRDAPTAVSTTLRFASLSAGTQHTCGITTDGLLACWGRNDFGELGISTPLVQTTPRFVVVGIKP